MKGNIKKLALLMIIAVIATFILAATVTADPPRNLRGQYAATGSGTALVAICGFGADFEPNAAQFPGVVVTQTFNNEAVFTFRKNGTGTVTGITHVVSLNFTSQAWPYTSAGSHTFYWEFTYVVAHDGSVTLTAKPNSESVTYTITFTAGPSKGQTFNYTGSFTRMGTITPDGKTIILIGGVPDVLTFSPTLATCGNSQLLINSSSVLIWQHDIDHP